MSEQESQAFPSCADGSRTFTVPVTLDFDKMYENVLVKHWGWMGDRPESFEEYCCMAVASHFADMIQWNEFRASDVIAAVKQFLKVEGKALAERAAARADAPSWEYAGAASKPVVGPDGYYRNRVEFWLDVNAKRYADDLHAQRVAKAEADNE